MRSFNPPATRETLFGEVVRLRTKEPVLQQGIWWFPERWKKIVELEIFLPQVEKLQKLCIKAAEKSLITRQDVLDHSHEIPDLFISSMIFGHGDGGLGPTRVARIAAAKDWDTVFERLEGQFRESVNGPSRSWKSHREEHRVEHLGPAFATKFAYFSALKQGCGTDLPLIADANTSLAIWWITEEVSRSVSSHDGYFKYVDRCQQWAQEFSPKVRETPCVDKTDIRADEIEPALFELGKKWRKS